MNNLLDFDPDCSGSDVHAECEDQAFLAWLEENNL